MQSTDNSISWNDTEIFILGAILGIVIYHIIKIARTSSSISYNKTNSSISTTNKTNYTASCNINKGDNVYSGCGFIYQDKENCFQECNNCSPLKFIPAEDSCETKFGGSCGIKKNQPIFDGCNKIYQSMTNCLQECGECNANYKFVPKY
ncbi:hypothetical protein CPAV1605_1139 [seawater metagenome]|uniref:Uncharacterized protein n=1 Tax=seawater metagenome TaxID=1561972 RepID=A0A5E8CJ80_9ZZZZ